MRTNVFRYFSGDTELAICYPLSRAAVRSKYPTGAIKTYDGFNLQVGTVDGRFSKESFLPVTRIVCFNPNGSAHKCGPRCRCAKGRDCECSCGGKFHGIDR